MKLFHSSFIEVYDHQLNEQQCSQLIHEFESSTQREGELFHNGQSAILHDLKKDVELIDSRFSDETITSKTIFPVLKKCIQRYRKKYESIQYCSPLGINDYYNFQRYSDETDGYKAWHTEHGPDEDSSRRVLVWMIYLNDAKCGTDFMHYGRVNAKKGRVVIWPSGYTHPHRSVLPNKGLKYLATGWIDFM